MKTSLIVMGIALVTTTYALDIPSDGSDGAFSPTSDTVVDLSLAVTGSWNSPNTANAGRGIYDSSKWAVVFKYSSVNIPAGVRVTFQNHPTHAPVVWLVAGNVTIDGTLSIAGANAAADEVSRLAPAEGGPGGFRGGANGPAGRGDGYGPGGAMDGIGSSGLYASIYGNPQVIPLIGGSGGRAAESFGWHYPGGGGGAILVAASGAIAISGLIDANGGLRYIAPGQISPAPPASGGAIRIIGETVSGSGQLQATPDGRIRIETPALAETLRMTPETVGVVPARIPIIWPPDDAPTVRVLSVDGVAAPSEPTARVVSSSDVQIQRNSVVQVMLETRNFPVSGVVDVRSVQKYGPAAWVRGTYVDGDFSSARWAANITFAPGFTTLQAKATVP